MQTENPVPDSDMQTSDARDLARLEAVVEAGLNTFIEVGMALTEIRDRRLYLLTHPSFETYCRERFDVSRARAYQLMMGAAVALSTNVDIPNEAVARALATFPAEHRATIAAAAASAASAVNRPLTVGVMQAAGDAVMQAVTTGANDVDGAAYPLIAQLRDAVAEGVFRRAEHIRKRQGMTRADNVQVLAADGGVLLFVLGASPESAFVVLVGENNAHG